MNTKWMTLAEIAHEKHLSLNEAQKLVAETNCPKAFKPTGTLYLI